MKWFKTRSIQLAQSAIAQFWQWIKIHGLILCFSSLLLWLQPGTQHPALADPPDPTWRPAEPTYSTPPILDPNNIPSEKVTQFVAACLKVVHLIERREGALQASETESESLRIEQEIEAEALSIIEKTGLTRQEYLQLLGLANTDPEFGERVAIQLQEASM